MFSLASRSLHPFRVLAVESSADDTCAAIVDASRRIWSNVVVKQHHLHEKAGGIHPVVAMRAHQRNMPAAVRQALVDASLDISDVDGIAFTRGPGLPGCLSVACNAAKTLAAVHNKPIVGVHHMQAHALTVNLASSSPPQFPCLTLLVSGGHTLILLATSLVDFRILATTVDKSIGSAIDRVVTLLQIKWTELGPGAALEAYCAEPVPDGEGPTYDPAIPMPGRLAFSFSGLHSFVERTIAAAGGVDYVNKRALARAFQSAAFAQIESKLRLALKWCERNDHPVRRIVVSGGVASNSLLRQRLKSSLAGVDSMELIYPEPALCTDNAVMIAWASMHRFLAHDHDNYEIGPLPEWSIEDLQRPPDRA
ncbi:Gcp-like domain-containing protein [Mycena belliarum]|uniref:N(6)-L-threonylcarbamoyladenine synthase n=1 Tax=Mycena belliarum TaxID=1033014 RepID=A0AAD6TTA6_9AGAR|nr:Gcp-like domain-containing protein [Mycena belliae]